MPYKDDAARREYQAARGRARRAERRNRVDIPGPPLPDSPPLSTADEALAILREQIAAVRACRAPACEKCRAISYAVQVSVRLIELSDIGRRLTELEAAI